MPTRFLREVPRLRVLHQTVEDGAEEEVKHEVPTVRWEVIMLENAPTPQPNFFPAGSSARVGAGEWLVFELLMEPERAVEHVEELLPRAEWPTEVGSVLMFENESCRLWDFRMPPRGGNRLDFHVHCLSYAFVLLGHGKLQVFKPVELEGGKIGAEPCAVLERDHLGVVWSERSTDLVQADGISPTVPGALHAVENLLDTEFREYLIELK